MQPMRALTTLLLAAVALSGCTGGDSSGSEDSSKTTIPPDQVSNGIEGVVQSEELAPLPMATVEIISLNLSLLTNSEGRYQFANLDPRDYLIVASKDGYRTLTQRAIVQDGKIHQLDFVLEAKPLTEPRHEVQDFTGHLTCKYVYGMDPESMNHGDCGSFDTINNKDRNEFQIQGPNVAQIVVEAFWEPTSEGSENLMMTVESVGFGHQDVMFGSISGPTGIRIPIPQTIVERYYPDGGVLRVRMDAGPSITGEEAGADFGFAIQQGFELYVTTFYVEPGPPSYTAKPESG